MDLSRISVGNLLNEVATRYPENEALVDIPNRTRFSYGQCLEVTNQLAKGFLKLGLGKGEHLALWAPNSSKWIITQFALAKIGGVLVSVDTNAQVLLQEERNREFLTRASCRWRRQSCKNKSYCTRRY